MFTKKIFTSPYYLIFAGIIVVALLLSSGVYGARKVYLAATAPTPIPTPVYTGPLATIGTTTPVQIKLELATSTESIHSGLSGRVSLATDYGMLFVFKTPMKYRFWMSDMLFPLDMLWINNGKVVDITAGATADFDPAAPRFYSPRESAQYVLEVNAGFSAQHGLQIGDPVTFANFEL